MNLLNEALIKLSQLLSKNKIPYMVIGGMANAVWGHPRATIDIDVTIWVDENDIEESIAMFQTVFDAMVDDPRHFVEETRVLPLKTADNVQIDVIFGALPFEFNAIKRAEKIMVEDVPVCFCSPEDLILHKIISKRERDLEDVKGIIKIRGENLDLKYLEKHIEELSKILERPEILKNWEKWKRVA